MMPRMGRAPNNPEAMARLGSLVLTLRMDRDMTQRQLADAMGLRETSSISRVENGRGLWHATTARRAIESLARAKPLTVEEASDLARLTGAYATDPATGRLRSYEISKLVMDRIVSAHPSTPSALPTIPELIDLLTTSIGADVVRDHLASLLLVATSAAGTPTRGFRAAMRPAAERDDRGRLSRVVYPERDLDTGEGSVRLEVFYDQPSGTDDDDAQQRRQAQ